MARRLDALLHGPHLRLPRPLDAASEWWSGRPPRLRMLAGALIVVTVLVGLDARTRAIDARWGGPAQPVLVATADLSVGDEAQTRLRRLPPAAIPPGAVDDVEPGAALALALPEGAVLTAAHLDQRGAAAGLPAGMRAVPIPTESGWGIVEGGWVDVWTLGTGAEPSELVAARRPVLDVRDDASGLTSLVGLAEDEVGDVTSGLALGRVLLTHAPAGGRDDR
jgi:hypothetical protein